MKAWQRYLVLAVLLVLALAVGSRVRGVLAVVLASLALAYILAPAVDFVERHRFSRTGAIALVYGVLALAAALVVLVGAPKLMEQALALAEVAPLYTAQLSSFAAAINEQAARFALPAPLYEALGTAIGRMQEAIWQGIAAWGQSWLAAAGSLLDVFLIPVLTFYLLKDKEALLAQLWHVLPLGWHDDLERLWRQLNQLLHDFLLGNVIVSAIVAVLVTAGLAIIGLDFALVCGLIVGALNIIPYFGAIIGAVPAVVIALFDSPGRAVAVIVVMFIAQQLESDVITPKIIGERIGVHPVAVILGVMVWGKLWGLWGVLLAVPATAVVKLLAVFALEKLIPQEARIK